jgi:hypothetical protein
MRRYAQIRRTGIRISLKLVGQSGRHPIPRHPAARIKRAYKLRQQPVETPGAWTARGFFSVAVKAFFLAPQTFPECVSWQPHCSFIRIRGR